MKNLKTAASLFLVFFLFVGVIPLAHAVDGIAVDEIHFPDANFRGYVSENCDTDGDGFLTDAEIAAVTELNLYGLEIKDLTGVACFTSLTRLNCTSNQLTALDVSENTALTSLWCNMNQLTELDVSRNAELTSLHCFSNLLQGLDLQANTKLIEVDCGQNPLQSMDLGIRSPLQYLGCSNLYLTSLDVSMYPQLQRLDCSENQLTELDLSGNTSLTHLWCYSNKLTGLDVHVIPELELLNCASNNLLGLDLSANTALVDLNCAENQLTSLDLSANQALEVVYCANNRLKSIDLSTNNELVSAGFAGQIVQSELTETDGAYLLDFSALVGAENVDRVEVTAVTPAGATYSMAGGVLTTDTALTTLTYTYAHGRPGSKPMDVTLALSGVAIDADRFPDPNFRSHVSKNFDTDQNGILSVEEMAAVTEIDVSQPYGGIRFFIRDLTGIGCFKSLTSLKCARNELTSLDLSANPALQTLDCSNNQLTSLDLSANPALQTLDCSYNQLTSLNIQANTDLQIIDCCCNQLSSLDVSRNTALQRLWCLDNQLTELDVRGNAHLNNLWCTKNRLTNLEVSANTELAILNCAVNQLTELDVHLNPSLTYLSCAGNQLTNLNLSQNTALTELNFSDNPMSIPDLSANTSLKNLSVWNLGLTSLDVSNLPDLELLNCSGNQLTDLDVSQNSALSVLDCSANELTSIDVSANSNLRTLYCKDNRLASLDLSANTVLSDLDCSGNRLTSLDLSDKPDLLSYGNYECGNQTADAELTELDGEYRLDLAALVGAEHVERVTVTSVTPEDAAYTVADGILTAESELTGVVYAYSHGGADNGVMEVTLSLTTRVPAHIAVDETNFPDAVFRGYVSDNCDTDADGFLNDEEIAAVTEMLISGLGISDLRGIEYFTSLTRLVFYNNQVTSLDVSKNTELVNLGCANNRLTSLDISRNTKLQVLYCYSNMLTSLDVSRNTELVQIVCAFNKLKSLDVSNNKKLNSMNTDGNQLTSLNVSGAAALTDLHFRSNCLTDVDLSHNTALTYLDCDDNRLTNLDLSNIPELSTLYCNGNRLTSLNLSANSKLGSLNCEGNRMPLLDISANTSLEYLTCGGQIVSADMTETGGMYRLDLAALVGTDLVNRVTVTSVTPDVPFSVENGVLTASTELTSVVYTYAHGGPESAVMDVTLATDPETVAIDETNFPDPNFRSFVAQTYDANLDGVLNALEILSAKRIDVREQEISDLRGIEHFTAATWLNCSGNRLTSLDVSTNPALTGLNCSANQLTELDIRANTVLDSLYCDDNLLTELDVSANTALIALSCGDNLLTELDVSTNTKLFSLECKNNHLTSLDVYANPSLTNYNCNFSGQKAAAELLETDGTYRLDLAALVGAEYVDRVTVTTVTPADAAFSVADGILTAETELTGLTYTYAHGGPDGVTMDVTLDLSSNGETYTISYDANGGTAAPAAQTKTNRRTLLLRDDHPTRSGWYFLGWAESADAAAAAYLPGDCFRRDADTTLYAVWAQPDLVLPAGLTVIEEEAFAGAAFSFVKLPQQTVSIERNAFADCDKLVYAYIPAEVTDIDPLAFGNASELSIIGVSGSAAETFAREHGFVFLAE